MLSTCLFANENIASTIASNILAGELNPVLRVVCYVLSNKFRRICHLRYRVQDNLICLPSAALRATNIEYNKFYRVTSFCNIVCNKFYRVSTFCNIEGNELYHTASFCHIAQQIISGPPFATLRATAYNVCLAHLRATNIIVFLLSATGVQPPAILISHQEPL